MALILLLGALTVALLHTQTLGQCTGRGPGCLCVDSDATGSKCARDGKDYAYTEEISDGTRTLTTSGCPNHAFYDLNPNTAYSGGYSIIVPLAPRFISSSEEDGTFLGNMDGATGMLYDGATIFSAYGGSSYPELAIDLSNAYSRSAPYVEGYSFDFCGQHSSGASPGNYHTHVAPPCLLHQLGQTDDSLSPLLGFMVDGFPIYGPRGPGGVMIKRCSEATADPTYCTDQCGGIYDDSQTIWADGYVYRYFMMGPYNSASESTDLCTNDMWRDIDEGAFSTCGYDFPETYYPFTPLCLRGCMPSTARIVDSGTSVTLPSCAGKTSIAGTVSDAEPVQAREQLDVYSMLDACMSTTCGDDGYPDPNECVHSSADGSYVGAAGVPTVTPSAVPSPAPTNAPVLNVLPTSPTAAPTTLSPTHIPTSAAPTTLSPTHTPTSLLTEQPALEPTGVPTPVPTAVGTTSAPTRTPTVHPTATITFVFYVEQFLTGISASTFSQNDAQNRQIVLDALLTFVDDTGLQISVGDVEAEGDDVDVGDTFKRLKRSKRFGTSEDAVKVVYEVLVTSAQEAGYTSAESAYAAISSELTDISASDMTTQIREEASTASSTDFTSVEADNIYSVEDPVYPTISPTNLAGESSSSAGESGAGPPLPVLVGGAVGGLVVIALLICVLYLTCPAFKACLYPCITFKTDQLDESHIQKTEPPRPSNFNIFNPMGDADAVEDQL